MAKINKENEAAVPQKRLHELFKYDGVTGEWVWIKKSHPKSTTKIGQPAGCLNGDGYVVIGIDGHIYLAHRLAWNYTYGDFPQGEQPFIDHINGNPSDNRIANLKVSSKAENNKNMGIGSNNKSGIVGVFRTSAWNGLRTKLNWYWRAVWHDESGKQQRKNFNVEKLGEDVAEQSAIEYRAEQLRLLELNHGIVYSKRHGT